MSSEIGGFLVFVGVCFLLAWPAVIRYVCVIWPGKGWVIGVCVTFLVLVASFSAMESARDHMCEIYSLDCSRPPW